MLDDNGGTIAAPRYQPNFRRRVLQATAVQRRLRAVESTQRQATPELADRIGRLYRFYPWARPGTLLSLARSGAEPGAHTAQLAAALEARRRDTDPLGWLNPGERAPAHAMDVQSRVASRKERVLETAGKALTPDASFAGLRTSGSAPLSTPTVDPSAPLDPNLAAQQQSQEQQRVQQLNAGLTPVETDTSGFSGADITRGAMGVTRAAGAVAASPLQATVGNFRNVIASVHPPEDAEVRPQNPLLAFAWSAFPWASVPAEMAGYDPFGGGFTGGQTQTGQIVHRAVGDLQAHRTPSIDLGEGFFVDPDSEIERARHREELRRGTILGSAITPGRLVAHEVVPPGSRANEVISSIADLTLSAPWNPIKAPDPYNLVSGTTDAAVATLADPTNALLGGTAAGHAASEGMGTTRNGWGLLDGFRWAVDPEQVARRLDSEEFRTGAGQWLADASYTDIRNATRANPMPAEVEVALADASTVDEVAALLTPHVDEAGRATGIGFDVRNAGAGNGITNVGDGLGLRRKLSEVRAFNMMPSDTVHLDDASSTVTWVERFLRNAHAPTEMVDQWAERMARTTPGVMGRNQRYSNIVELMGDTRGLLVDHFGVPEDVAHDVTRMFDHTVGDQRRFALDYAAGDVLPAWADPTVAGADAENVLNDIGPLLLTQHTNGVLPAPDVRGIRQLTSPEWVERMTLAQNYSDFREAAYQVYGTGEGGIRAGQGPIRSNMPLSLLYQAQDKVWKPFQLLRGAWAVRVVSEEQFRLVADGLEGFNHPAAWIAWITGRKGGLVDEDLSRGVPQFDNAMASGSMDFLADAPETTRRFGTVTTFARDDIGVEARRSYRRWWGNTIAQAAEDPVVQRVARNMDDLDSVKEWFRPGNPVFDMLADAHPVMAERRAVADRYIEQVAENIRVLAGENPEVGAPANDRILAAFRDGHFTDDAGEAVAFNTRGEARVSRQFLDALKPHVHTGPAEVVGRVVEDTPERHRFVNNMFAALGAHPTNYLSRSPAFRQYYWRHVEEMIPLASGEAQDQIIARAREAGLGRQQISRLREFASRGTGEAGIDALDDLAKGHALDDTRNLLYDLSERSQFFDIHRLVFPFGEAWQEVFTRWAGLLRHNPRMLRRAQQGILEARNQGFFFTDENGTESFGYPASGPMLNALGVNAPIRLLGSVLGLNMAAQVTPGVGATVQLGAAMALPRTHEWSPVRSFILPYGDQNETGFRTLAPPWLERSLEAMASPGDITGVPDPIRGWMRHAAEWVGGNSQQAQRDYMSTTNMVMASLMSTGRYGNSPAEMRRLERDAQDQAATLTMFRAGASFFAPSAPRPEISVETNDGQTAVIAALSEEYQNLQHATDGPHMSSDEALRDMLDRYGENIYMALQSKSASIAIGAPQSRRADEWSAAHPFARDRYRWVYGLFAPQVDENGRVLDYDPSVAARQYEGMDPEREPRSPAEFRMAANNMLAMLQLHEAEQAVGPESERTPQEREALRLFRQWLNDQYPGFQDEAGTVNGPTTAEAIEQLQEAAQDPDMASASPAVTSALRNYLEARDAATLYVQRHPELESSSFQSSQSTAFLRDALRAYADQLIAETPDFQTMWERVLSRELADNDSRPAEGGN